jgi:hypothetical protein
MRIDPSTPRKVQIVERCAKDKEAIKIDVDAGRYRTETSCN